MADWKFDRKYSMKKMFHFSKNCFLGHSPDVIAQLRKWGLCSKSTLAGHSQAITLLMGSFHVVLQGVFPITSDFADFALVELSFIMNAFFMTIPVGFTRKSLSAEWASKVLYLLVDGINMGCQGLRGEEPELANLTGIIQVLEVNAVDVTHEIDCYFEDLVTAVTLFIPRKWMDLQCMDPSWFGMRESLPTNQAFLAAIIEFLVAFKLVLFYKLLVTNWAD